MQTLGRRCIRAYSTHVTLPEGALAARTASTPLAVRLRRRKKAGPLPPSKSDANPAGLTPTEVARYNRLKALGQIPQENGRVLSGVKWIERLNGRRSRLRGFNIVKDESGEELVQAVGRRIYLPNMIFKLVRNHTLPGEPYNPYEATFRIPKSVTKTDIRSYLDAVYGVKTTYIRTDNYFSQNHPRHGSIPHKSYKRAVVGLVDPFYYPLRLEDMDSEAKAEREQFIETNFQVQAYRREYKEGLLRHTMGHGSVAFKFNAPYATKRSHILRLVTEKKMKREGMVANYAVQMRELREKGEELSYKTLKGLTVKVPPETHEDSSSVPKP